ncbi:DUF3313 domain-containing protein [Bordetella flabilis]|nr:DUF3313 domain-containing protein [Bordetella flabilis]
MMKGLAVRLLGACATVLIVAGCATSPTPKESGFLGDYSKLQKMPAPGGGSRLAYLNPDFTPARYKAVLLESVTYYPQPQPSDAVSMATLDDIRTYVDTSLRQKLGQKVRLVNQAGPGVARIRVAITAVGTESQALKAYQYIPVALVITGARALAEGGRPQDASVAIETSITDSMTQEVLYAAVRGGTGERVQSAAQGQGGVQAGSLRPLIDTWTDGASSEITRFVAPR